MRAKLKPVKLATVLIVMILALSVSISVAHPGSADEPSQEPKQPKLIGNHRASVDISNVSNGLVRIAYNEPESPKKLKVIIDKDGERYIYDLNSRGEFEPYPLQMGNGTYSIKVLAHIADNRYATIFGTSLDAELEDENAPFLTAHQLVMFHEDSRAAKLAKELTEDAETEIEKIEVICGYIVDNISYDYAKARTVKPGYLPGPDEILEAGKGICFDYASLLAAMLRSLGIPTKLVTGYVAPDYLYHAWNEVYVEGTGWIRINRFYSIYKEGHGWVHMDPTFAAGLKGSSFCSEFINNSDNYRKRLEY
ncbi:MAG: transglutaminase-like domain-containing protein [Bacillota bacterium]|nr:transglutaminase domain-containing protein [Candidatus Fermentithermobacillaceae bacterium]